MGISPLRGSLRAALTEVPLCTDGIVAGQLAKAVLGWVGTALHLIQPSFDAGISRTGGLRALALSLAPSVDVFKLPDIHFTRSTEEGLK